MPRVSVIIPTYNQPRHLELVLTALRIQTFTDFEVVIGDDGSTEKTAECLNRFRDSGLPFLLKHFWQPDRGRRVGEARNGAAKLAQGDWLIFIDGDMVVHPRFVESHLALAAPERILFGGRVKLSRSFSESLTAETLATRGIEPLYRGSYATCREPRYAPVNDLNEKARDRFSGWVAQRYGGDYRPSWNGALNLLSAVPRPLFQRICFKSGCNFSTSRDLFERVNGFDRRFNDLSGEDGEFFWRIYNAGAEPRSVLFTAIAYHLWHQENWQRVGAERTRALDMERDTRVLKRTRCENGLVSFDDTSGLSSRRAAC